jgi:hypothetical protein
LIASDVRRADARRKCTVRGARLDGTYVPRMTELFTYTIVLSISAAATALIFWLEFWR